MRDRLQAPVAVDVPDLVRREDPDGALRLELARLVQGGLQRPEPVAAMDERDRKVGRVLEAERPVERGVAAADDHAALARELRLLLDHVVEAPSKPRVDVVDAEPARLEGPVARRDDHRAGEVGVPRVRRQCEHVFAVLADPLERLRLLAEPHVGAVLKALLRAHVDELLAEDLREPGHVVDVLLRIRGRDLAADLLQRLDDAHRPVAVADVVGGREPDRARAQDRDVDDVGHGAVNASRASASSRSRSRRSRAGRRPRPRPGTNARSRTRRSRSGC